MIEGFLLGVIVTASATAAAFFMRFWRKTRDPLLLAFSLAFLIEAGTRLALLWLDDPKEGSPSAHVVRFVSYVAILFAIMNKNRR